jgi:hypothetical protein
MFGPIVCHCGLDGVFGQDAAVNLYRGQSKFFCNFAVLDSGCFV